MIVFLNGRYLPEEEACVSVFDRAFLYGDGLFETLRIFNGRPFRWAQHLERLQRGAEFLKIPVPHSPKELRKLAGALIDQNQIRDGILRLNLSRGTGPHGYLPPAECAPNLVMSLHEATPVDPADPPRRRLVTSSYRVPASDPLASFKTCNKLVQILAKMEAASVGADDALLLNTNGEVAEATASNLFWIYRDTVYCAPSGRGALPGITRAVVLEICQALGLPSNKKVIKPESLLKAEAIFLTLSSLGIVRVSELDGQPVGDSPLVEMLSKAYWEVVARP